MMNIKVFHFAKSFILRVGVSKKHTNSSALIRFMRVGIVASLRSWCVSTLKGLLDRDSFASQLATQMQMERLHSKIEMLLTIQSCRVPCIYAQASQLCGAAAVLVGTLKT